MRISTTPATASSILSSWSSSITTPMVRAETVTSATPSTGILWLTVRILAPARYSSANRLERTPGSSSSVAEKVAMLILIMDTVLLAQVAVAVCIWVEVVAVPLAVVAEEAGQKPSLILIAIEIIHTCPPQVAVAVAVEHMAMVEVAAEVVELVLSEVEMAEMVEMVAEMILQARLVVVALAEILVLEFLAGKFLQYLEIIIVQVEMVAMLQMVLLRAKTANLVHFVLAI